MFFAAVTGRYVLRLSAMDADVPLWGADQLLLHEWSGGWGGIDGKQYAVDFDALKENHFDEEADFTVEELMSM